MAGRHADFIRDAFAMWRSGRVAEFTELLDPDLRWDISGDPLPDFPDTGSGREAFLRHLGGYASGWVNYEVTEAEVIEVGEEVVQVLREHATVQDTDIVLKHELVVVWTVDDQRITRFRVFETREDALAALGAGPSAASAP